MYLKAVVSIKTFKAKKIYVSTALEEVLDYNQITYFMLNCFVAHAQRTQGYIQMPDEKENNPSVICTSLTFFLNKQTQYAGNSKGRVNEVSTSNYSKPSMGTMDNDTSFSGDPNLRLVIFFPKQKQN